MKNTIDVESKVEETASLGVGAEKIVRKPVQKTGNARKGKIETNKDKLAKDKLAKEKLTKDKLLKEKLAKDELVKDASTTAFEEFKIEVTPMDEKASKEKSNKKNKGKKATEVRFNKPIECFAEEISNSEVPLVIEGPKMELDASEKKKKKDAKSDKKKLNKKRTLCKLVKNDFLKKHFASYKDLVTNPEWICRKCGRVSNDPKILCKPILLSNTDNEDIIIS